MRVIILKKNGGRNSQKKGVDKGRQEADTVRGSGRDVEKRERKNFSKTPRLGEELNS